MQDKGMASQSDQQRSQFESEAIRISQAAEEKGLILRLLGSLAFHVHCPRYGYLQKALGRAYTDIDFAAYSQQASEMTPFFSSLGYQENREVNLYFGAQRMIFHHPAKHFHIDIFYDKLSFCHDISWVGRLEADSPTLPMAELLLEKMQIVKINEKDIIDTAMLLLEHPLGDHDQETLNAKLVSRCCAQDWGLWRTVTMNLRKVAQLSQRYQQLTADQKTTISSQVERILERIQGEPKSMKWRMRAKIGDKVKWYRDVDEVG